jgi:chemotaxis protein methyltransferase CheR
MTTAISEHPAARDNGVSRLTKDEFRHFQRFIYEVAGINMSDAKQALVGGRLAKRLKHYGFTDYQQYFEYISPEQTGDDNARERQMAVDLLTTNETYFFREPKHFDFLTEQVLPRWRTGPRRLWSAACSSGEEAYTLAMVLAEHCPVSDWEILGTDISSRMVEACARAQYPMTRADKIPKHYLHRYCLRGTGNKQGTLLVDSSLRARTRFEHGNLKERNDNLGMFDVIFLRNVMIYFNQDTKRQIVQNVTSRLSPGGLLMVGHSESLNGITTALELVQPAVYRKRG